MEISNNPKICRILAYCAVGKSRQEFWKFLGHLKFPHQPYKKWSLVIQSCWGGIFWTYLPITCVPPPPPPDWWRVLWMAPILNYAFSWISDLLPFFPRILTLRVSSPDQMILFHCYPTFVPRLFLWRERNQNDFYNALFNNKSFLKNLNNKSVNYEHSNEEVIHQTLDFCALEVCVFDFPCVFLENLAF